MAEIMNHERVDGKILSVPQLSVVINRTLLTMVICV